MNTRQIIKTYKLRKHPDNPRIIKDDKFYKLVESIKKNPEFLEKKPIVVNEDMKVLAGNMRLRALEHLGIKEVLVDIAEGWSEEKQSNFVIIDNSHYGEWDYNMLSNEWNIEDLKNWGVDIPTPLDFEEEKEEKVKCECCGK